MKDPLGHGVSGGGKNVMALTTIGWSELDLNNKAPIKASIISHWFQKFAKLLGQKMLWTFFKSHKKKGFQRKYFEKFYDARVMHIFKISSKLQIFYTSCNPFFNKKCFDSYKRGSSVHTFFWRIKGEIRKKAFKILKKVFYQLVIGFNCPPKITWQNMIWTKK